MPPEYFKNKKKDRFSLTSIASSMDFSQLVMTSN